MTERDKHGRFQKGHTVKSPGRPKRPIETDYLSALTELVTVDYWRAIVRRAIADAMQGDYRAREWLGDYLIGKPPQTINLNAGDTMLLKQLLTALESHGMAASTIFEALLSELASSEMLSDGLRNVR